MNRHLSTYRLKDQLTLDELRAYQANELSGSARHRVERLLLENPFYADALEGLEALQQVGGNLKAQTRDLHEALEERIHESATPRRLMTLWVTSLVASVVLVIAVAIHLIFRDDARKQAIIVAPHSIEPGTVLIDPRSLGTSTQTTGAAVSAVETVAEKATAMVNESVVRKGTGKGNPLLHRKKGQHTVAVEELEGIVTNCSPVYDNDGLPTPPITLERVDQQQVNTTRAFTNWPPGSGTTLRR